MQLAGDLNSIAKVREIVRHRESMRNHFNEFMIRGFQTIDPGAKYKHNWHIDCICEYAEAVYLKQIRKLIINVPPRSLKSLIISIALSAWILGKKPSERIIAASGVRPLATRFNDDTRKLLREKWYQAVFPDTRVRPGQDEKMRFETTAHGQRLSASVGSSLVGEGGNYGFIDDPIDVEKALSILELEKCNRWYDQTWSTRFNDPECAMQILIMQRLHRLDLTQHLLDLGGWEHLKLPQKASVQVVVKFPISGRKVKRKKGDFLHPERVGKVARAYARKTLGEYGYAAQEQQEPVAKGGNRIKMKWFRTHGALPLKYDETVLSFDTANKGKDINDPTVCMAFGRKDTQWYLKEVVRKRLVYPKLKRLLLVMEAKHKPNSILIEDKSSGQSLLQEAEELTIFNTVAIEPHGDKVARMELELPALEGGIISLPDPISNTMDISWLKDFESEIIEFPMCVDDDQIDALSQFLMWVRLGQKKFQML